MRQILGSAAVRLWLPVAAASAAVAVADRHADAGDLVYFVHRGERLLSGAWVSVYARPDLQSGPLQLVAAGAFRRTEPLAFVVEVGVALLVVFVLGRLGLSQGWRLVGGLAAVVTGLTHGAFVEGHPAEVVTPLLWVLAALDARRGRTGRAGLLLGVSAGLELWGLLGAPVLLLAPRLRDLVRGVAVCAVVVTAELAPFVLFGDFRMFDYRWRVGGGTLLSIVVAPGTAFGWPLRIAQAAAVCCVAGFLALRSRRTPHAVWIVPLSVALTRIALDPVTFGWYWLEVETLVLVGAALVLERTLPRLVTERREVRVQQIVAPEQRHD